MESGRVRGKGGGGNIMIISLFSLQQDFTEYLPTLSKYLLTLYNIYG